MKRRKKNRSNFIFLLLLCALCLPLIGQAARHGWQIYQVNQETRRTEKKIQQLKKENTALQQEKTNLGDLKYIEKVARDELNMVKKDEIPLFMVKEKQPEKK